jgi:hypothetical protein
MNDDHQPWSRGEPPHEGPAPPPRDRLPFHPIANAFPMLDRTELEGLVASIKANGLQEPIVLYQGAILDGRNRLKACEIAGVQPRFSQFDDTKMSAVEFVLAMNLHRRHLSLGQRAVAAAEMITTRHGAHQTPNDVSVDKAATLWGVSPRAVDRAAFVRKNTQAEPKIVAQVKSGKMELGRALMLAKKTAEEQREAPDVKFAGSKSNPKPRPAARPVTVPALRALTDEQLFAVVTRELLRINRAAAREGKRIIIEDLR